MTPLDFEPEFPYDKIFPEPERPPNTPPNDEDDEEED